MVQTPAPIVSFIVLGWNNHDLLDECFASIQSQTYKNFNIIYVDNGSADDSVTYVRTQFPDITVVDVGKNTGFAIGNNIGIQKAFENPDCRYVALVNTDATLARDWLSTLVAFAQNHPHSGAFQTPTYDYYDHSTLDSYGITVDHYGRAMQLGYRQPAPPPETRIVFGTNAAAALITREFLETQPFGDDYLDSDLWMYLEDVDLAARATVTGWQNWYVNTSAAYHMGSASSSKNPGFSVYLIYRNNFPMIVKNFPLWLVLRMLPGLILTDAQTAIQLLRGRNKIALKAMLKGRLFGLPLAVKMIAKHRRLKRAISTSDLWALMGSH